MKDTLADTAAEWMRAHSKTIISCNDVSELHEIYAEHYRRLGRMVPHYGRTVQPIYQVMRALTNTRRGRELFDTSQRMRLPGCCVLARLRKDPNEP